VINRSSIACARGVRADQHAQVGQGIEQHVRFELGLQQPQLRLGRGALGLLGLLAARRRNQAEPTQGVDHASPVTGALHCFTLAVSAACGRYHVEQSWTHAI
jgi:hypothetical protein